MFFFENCLHFPPIHPKNKSLIRTFMWKWHIWLQRPNSNCPAQKMVASRCCDISIIPMVPPRVSVPQLQHIIPCPFPYHATVRIKIPGHLSGVASDGLCLGPDCVMWQIGTLDWICCRWLIAFILSFQKPFREHVFIAGPRDVWQLGVIEDFVSML